MFFYEAVIGLALLWDHAVFAGVVRKRVVTSPIKHDEEGATVFEINNFYETSENNMTGRRVQPKAAKADELSMSMRAKAPKSTKEPKQRVLKSKAGKTDELSMSMRTKAPKSTKAPKERRNLKSKAGKADELSMSMRTKAPKSTKAPKGSRNLKLEKIVERKTNATVLLPKKMNAPSVGDMINKTASTNVYWINLEQSSERRQHITTMFSSLRAVSDGKNNIRDIRVPGISKNDVKDMISRKKFIPNGISVVAASATDDEPHWKKHRRHEYMETEVACCLSHLTAIREAYARGDDMALIVEDDVILSEDFISTWREHAENAPSDWRVLQWYTSNPTIAQKGMGILQDEWIVWTPEHWSSLAYTLNRDGMAEILDKAYIGDPVLGDGLWYIEEPEISVSDELVYFLAGKAYTFTLPFVSSASMGSVVGHGSQGLVETTHQDNGTISRPKVKEERPESVLVVTTSRPYTEEAVLEEIDRLSTDILALSRWHANTKWIINIVVPDEKLKASFEERSAALPSELVNIHSYVNVHGFNKFAYMSKSLHAFDQYDYVLIKDNDIRLAGFPWNTFMEKKGTSVVSGCLRETGEASLARNMQTPSRQWFNIFEAGAWTKLQPTEYINSSPIPTLFVEQSFMLVKGGFARWYFDQVLTDWFVAQRSDWGPDKMICGAAASYFSDVETRDRCVLVPVVISHEDTRQLGATQDLELQGFAAIKEFRLTKRFDSWINAQQEWESHVGGRYIDEVLERCNRDHPQGTKNVTECFRSFVDSGLAALKEDESFADVANSSADQAQPLATREADGMFSVQKHPTQAVIHMGPYKTGSTSIQVESRSLMKELKMDGYEMPWQAVLDRVGGDQRPHCYPNQEFFAGCFLGNRELCSPELLLEGLNIANRKSNILISAEHFSTISIDEAKSLSSYLSAGGWDNVTVVVYYRRYYDHALSGYNQEHKKEEHRYSTKMEPFPSIISMLQVRLKYANTYTAQLLSRLEAVFDKKNIVVMNFHDRAEDLTQAFFCSAMPDAQNACKAAKTRAKKREQQNRSVKTLEYSRLVRAAYVAGLVPTVQTPQDMKSLTLAAQEYHRSNLNFAAFKLKCLPPNDLARLLEKSLHYEKLLVPEFFESPDGEQDLRSNFHRQANSTLCEVDVDTVLKERSWKHFFTSFQL